MKDAGYALRKAYFGLLSETLDIGIYDEQANLPETGNYLILSTQNSRSDSSKDTFQSEEFITVDIVTRFAGLVGSKKTADDIADDILQAVMPTPSTTGLTITGFKIVSSSVTTQTLSNQFGNQFIIRKLLIFNHLITQQ